MKTNIKWQWLGKWEYQGTNNIYGPLSRDDVCLHLGMNSLGNRTLSLLRSIYEPFFRARLSALSLPRYRTLNFNMKRVLSDHNSSTRRYQSSVERLLSLFGLQLPVLIVKNIRWAIGTDDLTCSPGVVYKLYQSPLMAYEIVWFLRCQVSAYVLGPTKLLWSYYKFFLNKLFQELFARIVQLWYQSTSRWCRNRKEFEK